MQNKKKIVFPWISTYTLRSALNKPSTPLPPSCIIKQGAPLNNPPPIPLFNIKDTNEICFYCHFIFNFLSLNYSDVFRKWKTIILALMVGCSYIESRWTCNPENQRWQKWRVAVVIGSKLDYVAGYSRWVSSQSGFESRNCKCFLTSLYFRNIAWGKSIFSELNHSLPQRKGKIEKKRERKDLPNLTTLTNLTTLSC